MSDLICIGFDESYQKRIKTSAEFLEIQSSFHKTSDELYETAGALQPKFMIISTLGFSKKEDIAGEIQVLRQFFPDTFLGAVAEKKLSVADAVFVKKSGCNYVFLENDFMNTMRLEYVMLQIVKASFVPVKASDFKVGTDVDFPIYTLLPLNKKILPVVQPSTTLSDSRIQKLLTVGELFIKRDSIEKYSLYVSKHEDKSAGGLANRCRAEFHNVAYAHTNLVFMLTDQAEAGSYEQGKLLLEKCQLLAASLLTTLAVVPEPWTVIDQSTFGTIGSTDRSMMIAAMAALASFNSDLGVPEDILMAGLFCDLGLLDLSPKSLFKMADPEGRSSLPPEDLEVFQKHPVLSLNRLLERKLQISEKVKEIILSTHEQNDKKGFPRQLLPEKIPIEASLLFFHEIIDLEFRVKFGKERRTYPDVRKMVFDREYQSQSKFSLLFLEQIKGILL